ncbi:MAG: hypothetical protein A3F84_15585 [Candidatus Handelsmanbacteria bacterium RIFCSPLOWO2_12_FULL_64_10]|uniref:AAA+ ATPase domain-containing protein n=1 Tax=Handelsmanbacteria sp. (strain RIFCSPLOWO2_12_FULL_64_10) TaxID=1817868 RepID=A0A1F6D685_HANXR|nr:MAG: hypothetical protein A3F84_15585 [Candidatus Handelsmanbacteria bacterium RIFCSPLOWO2_12_FULL_64_10]
MDRDEFDLHHFLRTERGDERLPAQAPDSPKEKILAEKNKNGKVAEESSSLSPYKTDLEYLDDQFHWIATRIEAWRVESRVRETGSKALRQLLGELEEQEEESPADRRMRRAVLKRLGERERALRARCEGRLNRTRSTGSWLPRLERIAAARHLDAFEKTVLLTLTGGIVSPDIRKAVHGSCFEVGQLLEILCSNLQERIQGRRHFYRNGTLVREGMISLTESLTDLTRYDVEIDRCMMDFIVGLDTELSELIDGSHLYYPKVGPDLVVLPEEQKKLILDTVSRFDTFRKARRRLGFDDLIPHGKSMVMLFYGPSGTGKTMMANAVANRMKKKVLLVNFPSLGRRADDMFKYLFREARVHDAILFFDECESIFGSRALGNAEIGLLLTEIERHDGLVVLATNRPFDLDEAMHRRITLAAEFRQPDPHFRELIWRGHLPEAVDLAPDVDLKALAVKYELSGGFIKNAVLCALSAAVARDGEGVQIGQGDLEQGARNQLRSRLRMVDFDRRVVPSGGLDCLVLPQDLRRSLAEVVHLEKARSVLLGPWGFDEQSASGQGTAALFHGPPGTGKTLAAEAIGYEIGRPLKIINSAELLSRYVGDSAKNIETVFQEARNNDSILVFDEADGLFGARTTLHSATDRYANVDVGLLLHHLERHPGVVILTTNLVDQIDRAFFRRMKFVLAFPVPDRDLREALWQRLLPSKAPLAQDVDLKALAEGFEFTGGNIKNVIFKAAARAALRPEDVRRITMQDLLVAAQEERGDRTARRIGFQPRISAGVPLGVSPKQGVDGRVRVA